MNSIEKIIYTALTVHDNSIRTQAEQEIYRLVQINFTDFFQALAHIIGDGQKDMVLRTGAATIFKRLIAFKVLFRSLRIIKSISGIKSTPPISNKSKESSWVLFAQKTSKL